MSYLRKYNLLPITSLFCIALSYFTLLAAPSMTWINTDSDGATYLRAAKFLTLSHPTGAPLYNLINWLAVRVPIGDEFWRIAMVSALASSITTVLIYLIAKHYTTGWKTYLPSAIWLGSGLVVSQSTIVDSYALIAMIMVLAYYLHLNGHHRLKYLACALGIGVHHLIGFVLIPLILSDWYRKRGIKPALLALLGLVFYIYIPLANSEPYLWIRGNSAFDYIRYFFSQGGLIGGLAVMPSHDLFIRLEDFSLVFFGGFAVATILIIYGCYREFRAKQYLLPTLFILPLIYYLTDLAPQTFVYIMPSFAFGAILTVKHDWKWSYAPYLTKLALIAACILMLVNIQLYDIGRTLDKDLTATQFYNSLEEMRIEGLPDGSVIWHDLRGWEATAVWLFNSEHNLYSVTSITKGGGSLPPDTTRGRIEKLKEARDRGTLYRTIVTNEETYGVRMEKWNPSDSELRDAFRWEQ